MAKRMKRTIIPLQENVKIPEKPKVDYSLKSFFGCIENEIDKSSLSLAQATDGQEKRGYQNSIAQFLAELKSLNVFEVVTKPPDANIIGT